VSLSRPASFVLLVGYWLLAILSAFHRNRPGRQDLAWLQMGLKVEAILMQNAVFDSAKIREYVLHR
jgi:hypothetical protein